MGKIEDVLKNKIKQSILAIDRNNLVEFTTYLFDKLWKIPKERQNLIENIQISGVDFAGKVVKTRGIKPKADKEDAPKQKPEPKPKHKPKHKSKKKTKTIAKPVKQKTLSDEDIVKAIAKELGDEPEETIEVAEQETPPTKERVHFVRGGQTEEVEEMMK